jgi:hypothetical protein
MLKNINEEHVIRPMVTLLSNFRFHYTTTSVHSLIFFVEEIQQPSISYGVGIEPEFESM